MLTYFITTKSERGTSPCTRGWMGTDLDVRTYTYPNYETTPWSYSIITVMRKPRKRSCIWGLLNKIVLVEIFGSFWSGWNRVGVVGVFGWIIGNRLIPVPFLLLPPCFPTSGVDSMDAHPLGQGSVPCGWAHAQWESVAMESLKWNTAIILRRIKRWCTWH